MAPLFGTCTKNRSDKIERVQRQAARFVKRYSSVSDMLDVLGWTPLSQSRQEARLILFYKIINGLAQVPFEGVLVEAYKGTRRKHNTGFPQSWKVMEKKLSWKLKKINKVMETEKSGKSHGIC